MGNKSILFTEIQIVYVRIDCSLEDWLYLMKQVKCEIQREKVKVQLFTWRVFFNFFLSYRVEKLF